LHESRLFASIGVVLALTHTGVVKRRALPQVCCGELAWPKEVRMTLTLPGLVVLIIIAAICGAVGRALAGGARGGLIVSTAIGFIGALLGPWVARQFHLTEPFVLRVSGYSFPIVWSIIGSALFVALLHLLSGRRRIWS
jgi:uncharacterized membrane protein YeaQ/YmgE (transglycosylase-associated protein family)